MTVPTYVPVNYPSMMEPLAGPCMVDDPMLVLPGSSGCSFSSTASRPESSPFSSFTGSLSVTPRNSSGSGAFCPLPPNSLALPQYNHQQHCQPVQQQQMLVAPGEGCVYEVVPVAGSGPACSTGPGAAGGIAGCNCELVPFAIPGAVSSPGTGAAGAALKQELAGLLLLQQEEAEVDATINSLLNLRQQLAAMHMATVSHPAVCQQVCLMPPVPQQPLQQQQQYFVGTPVSMEPAGFTHGAAAQQQLELQQPYLVPVAAVSPVSPLLATAQLQQQELLLQAALLRALAAGEGIGRV